MINDDKVIETILKKLCSHTESVDLSNEDAEKSFTAEIIHMIKDSINNIDENRFIKKIIILCLFPQLHSSHFHVRIELLKVIRLLFTTAEWWTEMMNLRLDLVFAKSFDYINKHHQERQQVIGIIGKALKLCPELIPFSIIKSISQACYEAAESEDRYGATYLGLLSNFLIKFPNCTKYINIYKPLILHSFYKKNNPLIVESVMIALLTVYDNPAYRTMTLDRSISALFSPFVDDIYQHPCRVTDNCNSDYLYWYWRSTKNAIRAILTTWTGVVCLFKDDAGIKSIISVLPHSKPEAQALILDLICEIFSIELPDSPEELYSALGTIHHLASLAHNWTLDKDYVVGEAMYLLKPKGKKLNIVNIYQAFLLKACVDFKIIEILLETIFVTQLEYIRINCFVILGEILYKYNNLLPFASSTESYLYYFFDKHKDFFNSPDYSLIIKTVFRLEQYNKWKIHQPPHDNCSLLALFILSESKTFTNLLSSYKIDYKITLNSRNDYVKNKESAAILKLIDESKVCRESSYDSWNWDKVLKIFTHYTVLLINKSPEHLTFKFLSILVQFFKPHRLTFFNIETSHPFASKITSVAILLFKSFLHPSQPNEALQWLNSFISSIADILKQDAKSSNSVKDKNSINFPITLQELCNSMNNCLSREYFHIIGQLQRNTFGRTVLDNSLLIQNLFKLLNNPPPPLILVKVIIPCLYYDEHSMSRKIFSKAIQSPSWEIRLYCTKFLRILLRSNTITFATWGYEFVVLMIDDVHPDVVEEALCIIEEAVESSNELAVRIAKQNICFLSLNATGIRVLTRILCTLPSSVLTDLKMDSLIKPVCALWSKDYCDKFYKWFQEKLLSTFSNFTKDPILEKKTVGLKKQKKIRQFLFSPINLNRIFINLNGLPHLVEINDCTTLENAKTIGRNIIFLANYASTQTGLDEALKINPQFLEKLVEITSTCSFLSIRWIAIIALNIICISQEGSDLLRNLGWKSFSDNLVKFTETNNGPHKSKLIHDHTKFGSISKSIDSNISSQELKLMDNLGIEKNINKNYIKLTKANSMIVEEELPLNSKMEEPDHLTLCPYYARRSKNFDSDVDASYKFSTDMSSLVLGSSDPKISYNSDTETSTNSLILSIPEPINKAASYKDQLGLPTICMPENFETIFNVQFEKEAAGLKDKATCIELISLLSFGVDPNKLRNPLSRKCIACSCDKYCAKNTNKFELIECRKTGRFKTNENWAKNFEPKSELNINIEQLDASKEEDIKTIYQEIIRLFFNFISPSLSKMAQKSISELKLQYGRIFNDYCLYRYILDLFNEYNMSSKIRRFLHQTFSTIDYTSYIKIANIAIKKYLENVDRIDNLV